MAITWDGPHEFAKPDNTNTYPCTDDGGVYIIARKTDTGGTARYVGRTNSIDKRINEHCSDEEKNEKLKQFMHDNKPYGILIYYTLEDDQEVQKNIEYSAFQHYGGIDSLFNKIEPEGELIVDIDYPLDIIRNYKLP